jgi:tetratricopeptide (TPR) repeat protein/DNA-binding CsgD family transcriptional regulator
MVKNRPKSKSKPKVVSRSVLETRLKRAARPKDQLWAQIRLAESFMGKDIEQTKRALALLTEAEQLAERTHDRRGLATILRGIGNCHFFCNDYAAALTFFERALPIAEETGDAECEIKILQNLGGVYIRQSQLDLALTTLQQCAELSELTEDYSMQAATLDQIGVVLTDQGRYEEALEYDEKSLALIDKNGGPPLMRAAVLGNMGNVLRFLGRYAEAISAIGQSSQLFHAHQEYRREGLCHLNIGIVYSEIGDYPNALSHSFAAATILERAGDKLNLANAYGNAMQTYLQLGNTEQAKDFGEKVLAVFEEIGYKRGWAETLVSLGRLYLDQSQHVQARRMLKRGLALSREIVSKDIETTALIAMAKLEIALSHFDRARKLFQDALTLTGETGDRDRAVAVMIGLGDLFNKQGEHSQAVPFLEQAIAAAGEIHSRHHEQMAHQLLAEAFEAREAPGDLKQALEEWKLASTIKEEILGLEKQKAITELQIRSDIEKSESEKTQLKKEMVVLKKETESKTHEIERVAMAVAEKTEAIHSISHRIKDIIKPWSSAGVVGEARSEFYKLLSEIERDHFEGGEKKVFHNEFQLVHREMLRKLSKSYPALTFTERKVCVLLNEGLSTKQMAVMLKVSTRAIEWHRYGIRKKMKLEKGKTINAVLAEL